MDVDNEKNTTFQDINPFKVTDDSQFNFQKSNSFHNNKISTSKKKVTRERHTLATGITRKIKNESTTSLALERVIEPEHPKVNDKITSNTDKEYQKHKKNMSKSLGRFSYHNHTTKIPKQILKHSFLIKSNHKFLSILEVKKESVSEFVAKKREMLLLQMAINIKLDEINKLEDKAHMKQEALQRNEQMLDDDAKKFELFLKENDQKAHNAIRLYESEAKKKMEKSQQVKRLTQQLQIVQADLSKKTMVLEQCMRYKDFMDKLTQSEWFKGQYDIKKKRQESRRRARIQKRKEEWREKEKRKLLAARKTQLELEKKKLFSRNGIVRRKREMELSTCGGNTLHEITLKGNEPDFEDEEPLTSSDEDIPMYFGKPKQLLDIFSSLEENNLFLIQNTQETEHSFYELSSKFESTKLNTDSTRQVMEQNIQHLKSNIEDEKIKVVHLQERTVDFHNDYSKFLKNDANNLLSLLQEKVTQIYHQKQQLHSNNNNSNSTSQNNNTTINESETNTNNNNTESAPNTLFMLSEVEKEMSELLTKIEKIPISYLRKAKKEKAKKRRECKREEQLAIQQRLREKRNKKVLERSMQPPKKRTTKPVMFRSHLSIEKFKEEVYEMTKEEKDELRFLC